jgi:hypothetical protein
MCINDGVLDWMIRTFPFTASHTLGFSVFSSRILATDLPQSHTATSNHTWSFLGSLISFLPFLLNRLRLPSSEVDPILFRLLFCTPTTASFGTRLPYTTATTLNGPHGKQSLYIVDETCLRRRCLAIAVLLFRIFASAGMCLARRCLTMVIKM